jgi:hypothetical protein
MAYLNLDCILKICRVVTPTLVSCFRSALTVSLDLLRCCAQLALGLACEVHLARVLVRSRAAVVLAAPVGYLEEGGLLAGGAHTHLLSADALLGGLGRHFEVDAVQA